MKVDKKAVKKVISRVDEVIELGNQELARVSEVNEVLTLAKTMLKFSLDPNSILGRRYEKFTTQTVWHSIPRDGFALDTHLSELEGYKSFLVELLDKKKPDVNQVTIKSGEEYTGRQHIRNILSSAVSSIDLVDNYLGTEIADLLEPYLKQNVKVRIITSNNLSGSIKSDLILFQKQYPTVEIKVSELNHGRFIAIDNQTVFHFGHSLKDFGKKMDSFSKLTEKEARENAISAFESTWTNSELLDK